MIRLSQHMFAQPVMQDRVAYGWMLSQMWLSRILQKNLKTLDLNPGKFLYPRIFTLTGMCLFLLAMFLLNHIRHEHLYKQISRRIIRSDDFKKAPREIVGCRVILCTLSMLSHFKIDLFTANVPINTLVVDEASQIALSSYVAPLGTFSSIQKLCFIGDDKQCKF